MTRLSLLAFLPFLLTACASNVPDWRASTNQPAVKNQPVVAQAPATASPWLISGSLDAVYYLESEEAAERFIFPTRVEYFSWFDKADNIQKVTDQELAAIKIGGNVRLRPGTEVLCLASNTPQKYWVGEKGVLRPIEDEETYSILRGQRWVAPQQFKGAPPLEYQIQDAFFTNYAVGEPITKEKPFCDGMLFSNRVGSKVFLIDDGRARLVWEGAMESNFFQQRYVRIRPDLVAGLPEGPPLMDDSYYREHPPSTPVRVPKRP